MKSIEKTAALVSVVLALGAVAYTQSVVYAQPQGGTDVRQTFEDGQPGWIALGKSARLGITRDPEYVKQGNASLQLNYNLQKGDISAMAIPAGAALANMKSLSLWIKTDHATPVGLMIQEVGGGRWSALFHVPENQWQRVELSPRDFVLWTDANTPKDPNNQLDLEKVEWAGLGDFGQFFLSLPPALAPLFRVQPGPRTLWIDDVLISGSALAQKEVAAKTVVIDDFAHPQLAWIPLAGVEIMREETEIDGAKIPGLRMDYAQGMGKFGGLIRRLQPGTLKDITNFSLRAASENAAKIVLQLEETGGGKYNTILDIPAGENAKTISFTVDNFKASDDSKDDNGQLDLAQVQQMFLLDAAVFDVAATNRQNSLWIGNLQAHK